MKIFIRIVFLILSCFSASAENNWATIQPSYQQVSITGFTRARHSMILSTEVTGKVEQVFVDVGDTVANHGKVSCLDETFVKIDINSVKNEIAQHQINIRYFKKQVNRYKELVGKNSAAISQLDDFQRKLGNSQRQAQIKKLQKQNLLEKQKRYCIKSPAGWRIVERYIEPGQWLDIGNQVAKVGNYSKLLVPLALSVNELNALKKKQHDLNIWLPEYNQHVPGSIERISPAFDDKSRKIQVDLLLEENLPVHRGGLRVELNIDLPDPSGTFLIPAKTLDKRFEEVWVERKNGQSLRVELLGNAEDGQVRISSQELKTGDQFKIFHP